MSAATLTTVAAGSAGATAVTAAVRPGVAAAVGLLGRVSVGEPVDLAFGPGGGTARLRLTLTAPPPAPDPGGTTNLGVDVGRVALAVTPLDHEVAVPVPAATGTALVADLGADVDVRRVRVLGLGLPKASGAFLRFDQGGVRVDTPRGAGDPEHPDRIAVRAVISAGPRGGPARLPTRGFPGIGPPDAAGLYGDQLPGGTTSGTPRVVVLDCGTPVRAGRVELRFCTGDGPLDLAPVMFSAGAEVVHAAPPRGLRLTVGPDRVVAWQHDPPLTAGDTAELAPVLGRLLAAAAAAAAAGGPVTVDAELTCAAEARVRLVLGTAGAARTRRHPGPDRVPLMGTGGELPAGPGGDRVPDRLTARLTGSPGPVRRTVASPSPLDDPAGTGEVVAGPRQVARRVDAAALERRPLVRVGVPAAGLAGEVVVELRADAGGPGPVLAPGGVAAVPTRARPRWLTVDVPALPPDAVPAAGFWVVLRTDAGALLWADGGPPGDVMVSEDGGMTWRPAAAAAPGLALFVNDPDGPVPPLLARAGAVTAPLLAAPGAGFDAVVDWPVPLRGALPGVTTVRLDCARDLALEVADLTAVWTAGLELGTAP